MRQSDAVGSLNPTDIVHQRKHGTLPSKGAGACYIRDHRKHAKALANLANTGQQLGNRSSAPLDSQPLRLDPVSSLWVTSATCKPLNSGACLNLFTIYASFEYTEAHDKALMASSADFVLPLTLQLLQWQSKTDTSTIFTPTQDFDL